MQVLAGRIGEAIAMTQQLYPGLLRNNEDLHFRLKVSQILRGSMYSSWRAQDLGTQSRA